MKNSIADEGGNDASIEDTACYVCGKDCADGWFARIYQERRKIYLCGITCALHYFDVSNPPAHDHQARHQYYRVRAALLRAAQETGAGLNEVNNNDLGTATTRSRSRNRLMAL